ncbi:hypothetical protein R3P38DRAFT_2815220 [Favolaschia claudopus]|uniref:SAM domain-containing protein n=1 Tax=Favolaschia claudopus TaxID=2862362 RepID=A0AAV9Z1P2_9AGAR
MNVRRKGRRASSFPDGFLYLKTWFQSLNKQQRAATIVGLSILDSKLSLKKDPSGWSSNETTPTSDHGFLSAEIDPDKPPKKSQSNTQRRNALLALSKTFEYRDPVSKEPSPVVAVPTDISDWLRSIRLHKYDHCLNHLSWAELSNLTEQELVSLGVAAQGARDRLRKFVRNGGNGFECVTWTAVGKSVEVVVSCNSASGFKCPACGWRITI